MAFAATSRAVDLQQYIPRNYRGVFSIMISYLADMKFASRHIEHYYLPVALWVLLTLAASVLGPFGTIDLLTAMPRFFYWALIVAVSIGLDFLIRGYWLVSSILGQIIRRAVYVLGVGLFVYAINMMVFVDVGGISLLVSLGYVTTVSICIEIAVALIRSHHKRVHQQDREITGSHDPLEIRGGAGIETFMQKLPEDKRGQLYRMEAQGHYLRVVTDKGEVSILMRMRDALALLPAGSGFQTHRSHWVANRAALRLASVDNRLVVLTHDGTSIPVSRARQSEIESHLKA